jgi:HSP20 family protein
MLTRNSFGLPSIGWRNPFADLENLTRRMDLLTNAMFGRPGARLMMPTVFPAINITEDKDKYYVRAELPGMKAEDIKLEVTGRNLAITGERKIRSEGDNAQYHRREREAGTFSRIVGLPGDVDADSVDAKLVNGLLTVAIAKSAAAKAKQITVKTSK